MTPRKNSERDAALTARRAQRTAGQEVLNELALDYLGYPDVSQGLMFGSQGLQRNGKFFAFVGRAGDLVVKLPESQAAKLVAGSQAAAVRAGRNATREWVSVPISSGFGRDLWRELLADAHGYAARQ